MKSEKLDLLLPALIKVQGEMEHAKKDSTNPHFKSKYADLATVLDTCKPLLKENGLAITHQRESTEDGEYLITTLWHASGQFLSSRSKLSPTKADPQGFGSAVTYARRYDLSALIGLASDDDDGNAASKPDPVIDTESAVEIDLMITESGADRAKFFKHFNVENASFLKASQLASAKKLLQQKMAAKNG
jgi:hypothetical protein